MEGTHVNPRSTTDEMELPERISNPVDHSTGNIVSESRYQEALPPTDEGYHAWVALFGCFLSNGLIWGFSLSFGVMQEYYITNDPFASRSQGVAAIGTTATGLAYLTMPGFLYAFTKWPNSRRYSLWSSLPMIAASLIGASFADTVPQLIVCQGAFYGLAGNALVTPTVSLINEWFVRKKGLAIGIAIAGDGVGGVIMPLILETLLSNLGFRWTLRIIASAIVVLSAPLMFVLKERVPISGAHVPPPMRISFLRHRLFWALQFCNGIQALGYYLPTNYLPTIAQSFGLNSTLGSLTVLLVNLGSIIGCISVGVLVDRFDFMRVMLGISVLAGTAVLTVLGFTTTIAPLYVFSVMYGLTAAAYSTTWGGMIREVQRNHEGTDASLVFGLLAAGRGIGSIISGPLSEVLLTNGGATMSGAVSAYSSKYGPVIIFTGCTSLAGGMSWIIRKAGLI